MKCRNPVVIFEGFTSLNLNLSDISQNLSITSPGLPLKKQESLVGS